MNVVTNAIDKHQVELTITVDEKEVAKAFNQAVKRIATQVNIPGFRKGKAPRKVLEAQYGVDAIKGEAFDILVNSSYGKALTEGEFTPVSEPQVETIVFEEGKALEYKATFTKKPEVTLGQYKGLEAEKEDATVSEEEVEKQLEGIRAQHAELVVAPEGTAIANDDFAVIDFAGSVDGVPFDGGEGKSYPLQIGSNSFIPGFEEQLIGAKAGDDVVVKVTFPAEYFVADLAGKEAEFKVHVHDVKRKELPVLDDEFAKKTSAYESFEALKADLRKQLEQNKERQSVEKYGAAIIEQAVTGSTVEIPEIMVEDRIDTMLEEMDMNLAQRGMNLNSYLKMIGKEREELRNEYRDVAAENVKTDLVLEAVQKAEGITVSPEDMNYEIFTMAQNFGADPKEVFEIITKEGRIAMLAGTVGRKKAAAFILDNAKGADQEEAKAAE